MPPALADRSTQTRLHALSVALAEQGIAVLHQGDGHVFDLAENLPLAWPSQEMLGLEEADILPEDIASRLSEAHDLCRSSGQPGVVDFQLNDGLRRYHFTARLVPDADGVTTAIADVTDDVDHEATVSSLLREVSHRSKNLLAIIQSIAMQTAHNSDDIEGFLLKFRGRLHALSGTQDLVTESNWRGAYLQALIASQLGRVSRGALSGTSVTGPNPLLGPNASLHIGLAIHELAANAVFHGTLAQGQAGTVLVSARLAEHDGDLPDLVIEWAEPRASPRGPRQAARFGTLVLHRIVPRSVGGSADFSIDDDGVRYRLTIPPDQFEA